MTKQLFAAITLSVATLFSPLSQAESFASDQKHDSFDQMLNAYVKDGVVNYPKFQKDSRFDAYLDFIAHAKPRTLATEEEQLAFWINAYNALSIKGILDGKSPKSTFGRYGFFIGTKYEVAGEKISLNTLEKKVIIPYGEPRIHFAIVCASASCPKLTSEAYTAEKLDQQLTDNAIDFLNNTKKNQINLDSKVIKVSKIFDWFDKDFADHSGSVQQYIAQFIQDDALKTKLSDKAYKVKHLKYDWSLNGIAPAK